MIVVLLVLTAAVVAGVIGTIVELRRDGYRPRALRSPEGIRDPFAEEATF